MRYGMCHMPELVPAITTDQYTAGDCVGTIMSFDVQEFGLAVLKNIVVTDAANQKAALTILFFRKQPAGSFTNNSALPLSNADLALVVGKVNVAADDYETIASKAVADVDCSIVLKAKDDTSPPTSKTIYLAVLTTGTPTYASATDLVLKPGLLMD